MVCRARVLALLTSLWPRALKRVSLMKACIRRVEGDAERLTTGCSNSHAWRSPSLPCLGIEPKRLTGRDVSISVLAAVDSTGTLSGSEGGRQFVPDSSAV